jgi:nucleoside-diphosphate-sugar epimerase
MASRSIICLNHKESDPLAPDYHPDPYIRHKATTGRLLFRMRSQRGLPVVTFRPLFVYGANTNYYREQFFWDRLRAGRPIIIPGDGHRLMQFAYVNHLVLGMRKAMTEPRAVGEAFNVGDTKPLTQVELIGCLTFRARSRPAKRSYCECLIFGDQSNHTQA